MDRILPWKELSCLRIQQYSCVKLKIACAIEHADNVAEAESADQ